MNSHNLSVTITNVNMPLAIIFNHNDVTLLLNNNIYYVRDDSFASQNEKLRINKLKQITHSAISIQTCYIVTNR